MNRCRCLLLFALAGCAPSNASGEAEVAAELRALRQVLLKHQQATPQARSAAGSSADVAAALAPLREALAALVQNEHELQQRQLALTQELQRWSMLLVENATSTRREEGEALAARLRQLEASLQAQDVRHREVEALMQGALERTADRLGEFLRRVGADVEPDVTVQPPDTAAEPVPPATVPPAPAREATPPAGGGSQDAAAGDTRSAAWERRGSTSWWWGGIALLTTLLGTVCIRRWLRTTPSPARASHHANPASERTPAMAGTPDPDVQEIWAAAALLGEAVGRLRDAPADPPEVTAQELEDELIVLDDDLLSGATHAETSPPADEPPVTRTAPATATCRLRTTDPARSMESLLQILQQDPRVLRRPEPAVRCWRDSVEVSYRLVPELPPGERTHLEQRLRDACSSGT